MKRVQRYLGILNAWDALAAEQHIATEWAEMQGEAIISYLRRCIEHPSIPTFLGLMLFLNEIAPRHAQAGEGGNER